MHFSCLVSYLTFGVLTPYFESADFHLIFPPYPSAPSSSFIMERPSSFFTCHMMLFLALYSLSLNCSVLIVSCLSCCPNFQQLILLSCFFGCENFCPSSVFSFECVGACTHLFWDQKLKRTWNSYKDTREYDMCYLSSTFSEFYYLNEVHKIYRAFK